MQRFQARGELPSLALRCESCRPAPVSPVTAKASSTASSKRRSRLRTCQLVIRRRSAAMAHRRASSSWPAARPGMNSRPNDSPMAPASSASATRRSISRISSSVGARSTGPAMAALRTALWPTWCPILMAIPSAMRSRNSPTLDQSGGHRSHCPCSIFRSVDRADGSDPDPTAAHDLAGHALVQAAQRLAMGEDGAVTVRMAIH